VTCPESLLLPDLIPRVVLPLGQLLHIDRRGSPIEMRRTMGQAVAGAAMVVALAAGCGSEDSNDSADTNGSASASSDSGDSGDGTGASDDAGGAGGGSAAEMVSAAIEQATRAAPVTFAPESPELSESAKQSLKTIADAMKGNDVKLAVSTSAGYPDAAQSKALSEQRAQAIVAAFEEYGVAADRITTQATGNENAQGEQALQTQITVA
jgi:peptidoglycan-associated lipoprotein